MSNLNDDRPEVSALLNEEARLRLVLLFASQELLLFLFGRGGLLRACAARGVDAEAGDGGRDVLRGDSWYDSLSAFLFPLAEVNPSPCAGS